MKTDPSFCPSVPRDGDELFPNGIFVFNITRMLEYLEADPSGMKPVEVPIDEFPPRYSGVNESALDAADLDRPVVLAEIAPDRYNLIDGHHRVEKARRHGTKTLKAYKIRAEQHIAFLTTEKAYRAYVEYWNSKLKARSASCAR